MSEDILKNTRLTNEGFTFKQVYRASYNYYKLKKIGDNKEKRMKLDIIGARLVSRKKLEYDRKEKQWIQTGRDIKVEFLCRSDPVSYKKRDTINTHKYPITVIIHDIDKGVDSTFKWRTGSLFKPKFVKAGMTKDQRIKIEEYNIRKGIQLDFFFHLEWLLKKNNLLYGVNYAKTPPVKTNPKKKIYMDKHFLFIYKKILFKLLTTQKQLLKSVLNEERQPLK